MFSAHNVTILVTIMISEDSVVLMPSFEAYDIIKIDCRKDNLILLTESWWNNSKCTGTIYPFFYNLTFIKRRTRCSLKILI